MSENSQRGIQHLTVVAHTSGMFHNDVKMFILQHLLKHKVVTIEVSDRTTYLPHHERLRNKVTTRNLILGRIASLM
jgi:hypothetical protein